jgi:hypothetical protein
MTVPSHAAFHLAMHSTLCRLETSIQRVRVSYRLAVGSAAAALPVATEHEDVNGNRG